MTEEKLLERWQQLNPSKKEKVLELLESLEKSESRENYYQPEALQIELLGWGELCYVNP